MPRTAKPPAYRLYKRTGQAVITLGGQDHYLGPHGTKVSRDAYDRLVGEWLTNGRRLHTNDDDGFLTITEFVAAYWNHAQAYYVHDDGRRSDELAKIKNALRPLNRLYASVPVSDFGPLRLKAVRQAFIDAKNCRGEVNAQVGRIKRSFKWGVESELVPASVFHALQAVTGLKRGRTEARETQPVVPVSEAHVDAIQPYVSRQVWAIVQLQYLTGMRPSEVLMMQGRNLDMSGKLWLYEPSTHKSKHRGHDRIVELGPRAQAMIRPFLKPNLKACLFSPVDAIAERAAKTRTHRRAGQKPAAHKTKRVVRDHYDRDSYRQAITRACDLADREAKKRKSLPPDSERIVPRWFPYQLRHTAGTRFRKEFGLEMARILLGHRSAVVTEIYAEVDRMKAQKAVLKIG